MSKVHRGVPPNGQEQVLQEFLPPHKIERDHRLKLLLMEAALCPQSELSLMDMAPGSLASVCSTPASIQDAAPRKDSGVRDPRHQHSLALKSAVWEQSRHQSRSPVLRKKYRKTDRWRSPSQATERKPPSARECDLCQATSPLWLNSQHCQLGAPSRGH